MGTRVTEHSGRRQQDPFVPHGGPWRLLVQCFEPTEADAHAYLVRTFGTDKAQRAVLVAGTMRPPKHMLAGEWRPDKTGFRAYLPA